MQREHLDTVYQSIIRNYGADGADAVAHALKTLSALWALTDDETFLTFFEADALASKLANRAVILRDAQSKALKMQCPICGAPCIDYEIATNGLPHGYWYSCQHNHS